MPSPIGRFAPSPTGRMHLGNIWAALLSWLSAKSRGGLWILRIEDIDPQRSRAEYARRIEDDLNWLGLTWDAEYIQSERTQLYKQALDRLTRQGDTFPLYRSRHERLASSAPHTLTQTSNATSHTPTRDTGLTARSQTAPATALRLPDTTIPFNDGLYGPQSLPLNPEYDMILRRADGAWAYQLAVVVDDADMHITEVVRGRDLLTSVPRQLYLYRLLGLTPPAFIHIPLLTNQQGQRLCKRDKALDMSVLRQQYTPEQILGRLAYTARLIDRPEPLSATQLLPLFRWDVIPNTDICL